MKTEKDKGAYLDLRFVKTERFQRINSLKRDQKGRQTFLRVAILMKQYKTKADIIKELGVSDFTVYKAWREIVEAVNNGYVSMEKYLADGRPFKAGNKILNQNQKDKK